MRVTKTFKVRKSGVHEDHPYENVEAVSARAARRRFRKKLGLEKTAPLDMKPW